MLENDYNIIKPVENLSNVGSLAPIDQHSEKRRRQEKRRGTTGPRDIPEAGQDENATPDPARTASGSIDYRA
jgi:hypothetical protein